MKWAKNRSIYMPEETTNHSIIKPILATAFIVFLVCMIGGVAILLSQTENGNLRKAYYYSQYVAHRILPGPELPKTCLLYEVCQSDNPDLLCLNSNGDKLYLLDKIKWAMGRPTWNTRFDPNQKKCLRFFWNKERPGYLIVSSEERH